MRKGQKKCIHRFKGIFGNYVPRWKVRIIDGKNYHCVDYQCQIKGCQYWKLNRFKNRIK